MKDTRPDAGGCVEKYHMIGEGDRIAVGVSGGKDSLVLLCPGGPAGIFIPAGSRWPPLTADPPVSGEPADFPD